MMKNMFMLEMTITTKMTASIIMMTTITKMLKMIKYYEDDNFNARS